MRSLKLQVVCVGKPRRPLARAIAEYEARAGRYFDLRIVEVRAGRGDPARIRATEADALLISVSDLTLSHEFARLVLAEQLYRAGTILRGEPYHRGG